MKEKTISNRAKNTFYNTSKLRFWLKNLKYYWYLYLFHSKKTIHMYCIWMDSWTSDHYLSSSARKFCFFCLGLVIRSDTLKIFRYPKSVKKWVKMQVEQVYSLLFFGIFDDFAKFCFNFGIFLAYSVMKIHQICKKPFLVLPWSVTICS